MLEAAFPILNPVFLTVAIVIAVLGVAVGVGVLDAGWFFRRFVKPASPGMLGAIRMWICTILLINTLWEDLPSTAALPIELTLKMGIMSLLTKGPLAPLVFPLLRNPAALQLFQGMTALLLVFGILGLWTRVSIPAAAVCYLIFGGILRQSTSYFHTCLTPECVLLVLAFFPCGDGWSVDRLRKVARGESVPPVNWGAAVYGWGRYLCWIVIAMTYTSAGLCKLRNCGFAWCDSTNFRTYIYGDALNPMQFDFDFGLVLRAFPDWSVSLLAAWGLCTELLFSLVLFSTLMRHVLPIVIALMHVGILFLQNFIFFDLILIQLIFFDFSRVAKRIGQLLQSHNGPITIQFDSHRPSSALAAAIVRRLDLFDRFTYEDHETDRPSKGNSILTVVHRDRVYLGDAAARKMALSLPAGWSVFPLLLVPGGSQVISDFLGLPQQKDENADPICTEVTENKSYTADGTATKKANRIVAPVACGLACLFLVCWVYKIEKYPLSAMQMYSRPNRDGIVRYFKYIAYYENGAFGRAPIEACFGAMRDSRYRRLNYFVMDEHLRYVAVKFFNRCADRYNATAAAGHRITDFQVEGWAWKFLEHPDDPGFGQRIFQVRFHVFDLPPDDNLTLALAAHKTD